MTSRDAVLEALKGYPISCKYFENPRRFITFIEHDVKIDVVDSDHLATVCFSALEWRYGTQGWFRFSNKKLVSSTQLVGDELHTTIEVEMSEKSEEAFVDEVYLSDQLDEVRDLLEKVLDLANERMKKKGGK